MRRNELREQREKNFFDMVDEFFLGNRLGISDSTSGFDVDIVETENEYTVEANVPGIDKDKITIDLDHDYLTISYDEIKEVDTSDTDKNYIHKERSRRSASRRFYLKHSDGKQTTASLKDGVLRIVVPKTDVIESDTKISIE